MSEFRSGFVAVIGRPNVGKSTLINSLLGQKIAAVSPRPQTTRKRQLGILTRPDMQLVFVDTPGVHEPRHKLGEFMNQEAEASLQAVDVILFLVDLTSEPTDDDARLAATLRGLRHTPPIILVGNKIDLLDAGLAQKRLESCRLLIPMATDQILISATRGQQLDQLVQLLADLCPARPAEFEEDQVTDIYEKDIAADLVREAALFALRDEVPHGVAVRVEEYKERENGVDYIRATMLVERDSQKAIVIGQGGKMLKQIGTAARREIEKMTGRKAFLELRVKVEKGWRNRESVLEQLGYKFTRK
ncbi:MAG TPA: GTPase Era [Anaerolineales bacterium]|nr:GTPase Era [Anaerolineales bacterium]